MRLRLRGGTFRGYLFIFLGDEDVTVASEEEFGKQTSSAPSRVHAESEAKNCYVCDLF